jgi:hypothetical protein
LISIKKAKKVLVEAEEYSTLTVKIPPTFPIEKREQAGLEYFEVLNLRSYNNLSSVSPTYKQ